MMIEIDRELKDILICALRYALSRETYIIDLVSHYIMSHPELVDDWVKQVMLSDLDEYFEKGIYITPDDECEYNNLMKLYSWLDKWIFIYN